MLYVSNEHSNTVSVIDGNTNELQVGTNFNVFPANSGYIICNDQKIVNSTYIRYDGNNLVECKLFPSKEYGFDFWSGSVISDAKSQFGDTFMFDAGKFGNLTANFESRPSVDLIIPFETWVQIVLIIITAIVEWLIPGIVGFLNKLRQKNKVIAYMQSINEVQAESSIELLREKISTDYAKGTLDSTNYDILNKRIDEMSDTFQVLSSNEKNPEL